MNRNVESHFAVAPTSIDVNRSQFDRSSSVKFTFNVGDLIPFYVDEVLPGDTFKISTSKVVRLQTLIVPMMDNMYLDTYWFFVPNRLVWDHWKEFCGENLTNPYVTPVQYTIPQIEFTWTNPLSIGVCSLADYIGVPPQACGNVTVNALPFRGYGRIYMDWFYDQNIQQPLNLYTGDATLSSSGTPGTNNLGQNPDYGWRVMKACKYHDYFTSCLPAPQSGPAVNIPTSGQFAKVGTTSVDHDGKLNSSGNAVSEHFLFGSFPTGYKIHRGSETESGSGIYDVDFRLTSDLNTYAVRPSNLYADVTGTLGTINDLRIAFQVQKFYEKMNYGRRYIEILKSQFGVTSPDARLQRSEYLGGNRIPLSVHEVVSNADAGNSQVGDLGAMSRTVDVHDDFVHSFTEHGFVFGLCCVRYDHTYGQGIDKMFWRKSPFDYYWPVFANIGEQAVLKREINYLPVGGSDDVFGFQEAWADYRYKPNRVVGELRPSVNNSKFLPWTLADEYDDTPLDPPPLDGYGPFLSPGWIVEDPSNVDRVLSVSRLYANQVFADFYVKNICTRVMPMYSIPGFADHH